jgi:hypothetical protein
MPRHASSLSCLLAAAALLAVASPAQAPLDVAAFTAARQWLASLGHPAIGDRPFVRATTGRWFRSGNEPPQNGTVWGFLLDDDGRTFTVLTPGLAQRRFTRTAPGTVEHERVGYAPTPLREHVRRWLPDGDAAGEADTAQALFWGSEPEPATGTQLFVLACGCHEAGDTDTALALAGVARDRLVQERRGGGDLVALLAADLGHVAMWRFVLAFDDPQQTWSMLRDTCDRFLRDFPASEHVERARAMRAILDRMATEAAQRPSPSAAPSDDERMRELVFALREQNGKQWSQPGACDVFADPRGEQSPAHRLVACGTRAIPHLLPAFDDDSFTHSIGCHRDFYFSHEVLRVRDVAAAVFSRITGTWVRDRADAERVWREWSDKGERAVLVAGTARGDAEFARRLLAKHPEALLPALREGLVVSLPPVQRCELIEVLAGVPGEAAEALLRAELRGPDLCARATAAVGLFLRGQREVAIDAMIEAWPQAHDAQHRESVGLFLATCGATRAIAALAAHRARLVDDVYAALGSGTAWLPAVFLPDGTRRGGHYRLAEPEPGAEAAIEDLLAAALDDTTTWNGNWNGTPDPTTADFAATALQQRWPGHYTFDFAAPRRVRERQVLAAKNVWRQRRGQPLLPLPAPPALPRVDAARLAELVATVRRERSPVARQRLLDAIESIGRGALPEIVRERDAAKEAERTAEWAALASHLASHVREVRLAAGSAPLPDDVHVLTTALTGRRLDIDTLVLILATLGGDGDARPSELRVTIRRDEAGTEVEFALATTARASGQGVSYSSAVSAGTRHLDHTSGAGRRAVAAETRHYADFAKALLEALAARPEDLVDASYSLRFR